MQTAGRAAIDRSAPAAIDGRHRRIDRLLFAVVALLGLGLDATTKAIAVRYLDPEAPTVLAGGLLQLRLIRNPGAAFSLGENFTVVFAVLSLVVLGFVLIKLVPRIAHPGWAVALGLLAAGVCGNLTDRIFREPSILHGHVVDFLELPHWPIFNVADMCITSAAVLIIVLAIVKNVGLDGVRHVKPGPATVVPEPESGDQAAVPGPVATEVDATPDPQPTDARSADAQPTDARPVEVQTARSSRSVQESGGE